MYFDLMLRIAPNLITAVAQAMNLELAVVDRYWRHLRAAGIVPAGRGGRGGFHPAVDSTAAVNLVLALVASESARGAVRAMEQIARLRGRRLYRVYARFIDAGMHTLKENEIVLAPDQGTIVEALTALLDLHRAPSNGDAVLAYGFGDVRVSSAKGEFWAEVELARNQGCIATDRPKDALMHPERFLFALGRAHLEAVPDEIPTWAVPGPFRREASFSGVVFSEIAEALGRLTEEEWDQKEWPKAESKTYQIGRAKEQ